jgi:hypothetical protein
MYNIFFWCVTPCRISLFHCLWQDQKARCHNPQDNILQFKCDLSIYFWIYLASSYYLCFLNKAQLIPAVCYSHLFTCSFQFRKNNDDNVVVICWTFKNLSDMLALIWISVCWLQVSESLHNIFPSALFNLIKVTYILNAQSVGDNLNAFASKNPRLIHSCWRQWDKHNISEYWNIQPDFQIVARLLGF